MKIRKATQSDQKSLVDLLIEFNNYYYEENIFSEEYLPFWEYKEKLKIFAETADEWLTDRDFLLFVAEENLQLVGYICGQVKNRQPRVLDKEGYIHDWFVNKEWRNKSVGMKLYQELLTKFKEAGCNRIGLRTNAGNKKTIEFYRHLGFIDEALTMVKKI